MAISAGITQKRILVTGGTGTLGGAIVRQLCVQGYGVTANYCSDLERARMLAAETGCELCRADVTDEGAVAAIFAGPPEAGGTFDHVVHCAGWNQDALVIRQSVAGWQQCLRQNTEAAFFVIRESLRVLPPGGHILVLSSRVGNHGCAGQSAYAAAKGAVTGLVCAVAPEARQRGLLLNCVFPGFVPSAISHSTAQRALDARSAPSWCPDTDAMAALANFVTWELEHNRSCGQVFCPDFRIEGGGAAL